MVLDPPEYESVSPQQTHRDSSSGDTVSVMEFIQNLTIGSPKTPNDASKVSLYIILCFRYSILSNTTL